MSSLTEKGVTKLFQTIRGWTSGWKFRRGEYGKDRRWVSSAILKFTSTRATIMFGKKVISETTDQERRGVPNWSLTRINKTRLIPWEVGKKFYPKPRTGKTARRPAKDGEARGTRRGRERICVGVELQKSHWQPTGGQDAPNTMKEKRSGHLDEW